MLDHLKTVRDLALSAALTLTFFGTPVGVAAIKNVPMLQEAIEAPAEEVRVVRLPAPEPKPEPEATHADGDDSDSATAEDAAAGGRRVLPSDIAASTTRGGTFSRTPGIRGKATNGSTDLSKKHKRTTRRRCTPDNPQIVLRDDGLRIVDRNLVDHYAGSIKDLNRLGYVKKHTADDGGRSDGLLVRGIRCGNDLHELGIRNNDVVHTVNGKKVKNLFQAVALYIRLKGKDDFEVELTRGGKLVKLRYRLT